MKIFLFFSILIIVLEANTLVKRKAERYTDIVSEQPNTTARFRGFVDRNWNVVHQENERNQQSWLRKLDIEDAYGEFMALYEMFGLSTPEDLAVLYRKDATDRIEIIKLRQRAFQLLGSSKGV